jgi:hypothetical protein
MMRRSEKLSNVKAMNNRDGRALSRANPNRSGMVSPSNLIMSPQTFTYIARDNEERTSHLDLHAMTNLEDPAEHAHKLLREHRSCDRVEIWQDETFIAAISRVDQS